MACRRTVLSSSAPKQAESGQWTQVVSWGEHNPHKNGFLWVRLELMDHHGPDESCFLKGLHFHCRSSPPTFFYYFCPRVAQFLCGPVLVSWAGWGMHKSCSRVPAGRCVHVLPAWKTRGAGGEVVSVLSPFERREHAFQFCFPFLGRKYIPVLHSLLSCASVSKLGTVRQLAEVWLSNFRKGPV